MPSSPLSPFPLPLFLLSLSLLLLPLYPPSLSLYSSFPSPYYFFPSISLPSPSIPPFPLFFLLLLIALLPSLSSSSSPPIPDIPFSLLCVQLLDLFPEEGGQKGKKHPRLIPYLPGKNIKILNKSNRDMAEKRLPELARYARYRKFAPPLKLKGSFLLEVAHGKIRRTFSIPTSSSSSSSTC